MPSKNPIIIGGGISGLSAAYDLRRAGIPFTLIEKQPRLGGVIETRHEHGCTLECGPDSFLSSKPDAIALIQELGLDGDVIGSNDHQRTTYILKRGRLVPLPEGMMMIVPSRAWPMVKSPLLGWGTKIRMGLEYFRRPSGRPNADRSVAEFVGDHFGRETLDYLAEPLLSGVYGGNPASLSVASVLPRFAEMEAKYGSLVRGVLASRWRASASTGSLFRTLKQGLGSFVNRLAEGINHIQGAVESIEHHDSGVRARVNGDWMEASDIIVATPAWNAAPLLAPTDGALAELLFKIDYSSSLILSLIYDAAKFDGYRAGFGFLVPAKERHRLAACTFVGTKFSHRVPDDRMVLRCFFGGTSDPAVLSESDASIVNIAKQELKQMIGLTTEPLAFAVSRWPRAMAQYAVGHATRAAEIRERATAIPWLALAGNAYEGIGIPDCIRTGRAAARRVIER